MTSTVRYISLLLVVISCVTQAAASQGDLQALDRALSGDYAAHRQEQLDSLSRQAAGASDKWPLYFRLAGEYADFNVDSALIFIHRAEAVANTPQRLRSTKLRLAALYNSSLMMQKEASEIFSQIDITNASPSDATDYYILGVQLFRNLESLAPDQSLRGEYARQKQTFRDSVRALIPDEKFMRANELLDAGNGRDALALLLPEAVSSDYQPANGALYHLISRAYAIAGDSINQVKYLTRAADADIRNGVREYLALPQLALKLYEAGDIKRAYAYMQRALDDARACNARVRMLDMTETVSIISNAYTRMQLRQRRLMSGLLIIVALLLIVTASSLFITRRRNRQLALARRSLEDSNKALAEASRIKEKSFKRFLHLSREYLKTLDRYRSYLFKIGAQRNFDSLFEAIKSDKVVDETAFTFFESFDTAFLEQYPDFISELNSFLQPRYQISLPPDYHILSTELRIFALMKLGITESAEIARFLHCSQSTVYNYRTRFRAKTINKEAFDAHFFL